MDIPAIAQATETALAPFIGLLLAMGRDVAKGSLEDAGARINAGGWARAKSIWQRLRPAVERDVELQTAAETVALVPGDDESHSRLRDELARVLRSDPELSAALSEAVAASRAPQPKFANTGGEVNIGVQVDSIQNSRFGATGEPCWRSVVRLYRRFW